MKITLAAFALLTSLILAGCGDENDVVCPPNSVAEGDACHVTVPAQTERVVPSETVVPSTETTSVTVTEPKP